MRQVTINLKVNDREIPLNKFVETVFVNVINGLIESLDRTPDEKERIEITITDSSSKKPRAQHTTQ